MKKNLLVVLLLGAVSSLLYGVSMADYAFPGLSAHLIASWRGLDAATHVQYPLMAIFAKALGAGNLIAPVCGVLAVAMVFVLVSSFVVAVADGEAQRTDTGFLGRMAGVVAAVVFMFTPAVHESASHLDPHLFDALWMMAMMAVLLCYSRGGMPAFTAPVIAGAMLALGFCDSAMFVAVAPLAVIALVSSEVRRGGRPVISLTVFFIAFVVAFFSAVGFFGLSISDFLKQSASELKGFYKTPGWLFVALFSTAPFVISVFSCRRAFNVKQDVVQLVFHVLMSVLAVLAIATPLSPSSLMRETGDLPVLTSAYAAAVAGYLVAYWWNLRTVPLAMAVGIVFAFVVSFASLWNLFAFDNDRGAFADETARKILSDLGERKWFVSDGTLDDHLLVVAEEEGKEINLISLQRDLDHAYLKALGKVVHEKKLGGEKNADLCLSLTLGVLPFVQDWFACDPSVKNEVAIYGAPDLWYSSGLKPVPEFLFFGCDKDRKVDWSEWEFFNDLLSVPKGWGSYNSGKDADPVEKLKYSIRRHLGLVANNRGVYLQDAGLDDEAFKMYELVLNEIDADNISSLFNEVEMAGRKYQAAVAKKAVFSDKIKKISDDKNRRYVIWRLGYFYGYIRNPDMFIRLGITWARSGRPGDALVQIRRAIDFVPDEKRASLLNMMAALYVDDNDRHQSRKIYESILAKNDRNHDALMGMMRLELLNGDSKKALQYLERAIKVSPSEGRNAKIELSMVSIMKNDLKGAKEILRKLVDENPKDLQAWSFLSAVVIQQFDSAKGDVALRERLFKEIQNDILPQMEKNSTNPYDYYVQTTKAFIYMRQGAERRREARDALAVAMRSRPGSSVTQDLVLSLDISLDDRANAEHHAREVLRRNRNSPLANYVMGSLALRRGQYREAEAFLRKSADASQPNVLAMNDLAEVLRRNSNFKEAEFYARKAIEKSPDFYIVRETLASVLMDAGGDLEEAEQSVRKAIELSKAENGKDSDIRMFITLARVQSLKRDTKGALSSIRKVLSRIDELSDFEKREFEEIKRSVR